ncbi:hypothetical protein L6164_032937 [Bauhinia variegata]|uniref:Uncharacterized protein n=1 Tax=Bauhinia variegata TaxID=167791 RepID=A0ACB9KQK3_BAUVA|nr:hypothetical protein L6164_032937 [Bauhinia variegata]
MEQTKGCRLLLFPLPLQGHINPMLELAQILYSKGFSITIIHSTFNSPNSSNYPHFTFYSFPDGLSQTESSASDLLQFITLLNTKSVKPFRECLTKLLSDASDDPFACLISDAICYFTQAVAKSLGLPRIVLRTSGLSSFLVFAAFPLLREKSYFPVQDSRLEESVQELPPLRVKDLPVINTKENEEYHNVLCNLVNETMASSGVDWNSFEELESSALQKLGQKFSIPMFPIGPFHKYFPSGSSCYLFNPR